MGKPILSVVIVDDEPTARYGLRSYVNKIPSLKCIGEFQDVPSLERYMNHNPSPDIIFIDILMPEMSGLDFIATKTVDSAFIIVSAFEQYALKGFELNVCDYLLKPVSFKRFVQAVDKTTKYMYYRKGLIDGDFIFIRADRMIHRVRLSDIEYIESLENYVKIVTTSEKIVTRSTFKEFLEPLTSKGITQVHRSYAVNVARIKKIDGNQIITEDGNVIPQSKTYKDKLTSAMVIYGGNRCDSFNSESK